MDLLVHWCPRCKVQSQRAWHFCEKGPPLFPQLDEETRCEDIEVVPAEQLRGAVSERDALRLMLGRLLDVALVDGYGETVADEARVLLTTTGGR